MSQRNFDQIMKWVGISEGNYVDHPKDPGGATNHGITIGTLAAWRKKRVSKTDVLNLTKEEADQIYKAQYWDTVKGDDLPSGIDYAVFDYGVNSGPSRAIKSLQKALGVTADGVIGMITLNAVRNCDAPSVITKICEERWAFMKRLRTWPTFGKGWTRRVMGNMPGFQSDDIGVIDRGIMLYSDKGVPIPEPKPVQGEPVGKAEQSDVSALSAWTTPQGAAQGATIISGLGSVVSGSGPVQWAFAAALVIAAGTAAYLLISKHREA